MSLWIIKGSDFVDALKRAFQKHDRENLNYLMTEFSIADHGVTKRQKFKFVDGPSNQAIAAKIAGRSGRRSAVKDRRKTLILIRTRNFKAP